MWNLKKKNWYRQAYFQSRNRDTDVENKLWIPNGVKWGRMNWEIGIDMHILLILCMCVCVCMLSCSIMSDSL